ncbi:MAG: hypothetical protein KatS3mg114_1329 [Planctomycetaceae bacterium]|nr:MAG: hypothetical protein KatS3mg114_1329 [Planctomycetaceae bacterium]
MGVCSNVVDQDQLWLAIDVGNTRIKYGWYRHGERRGQAWPECCDFLATPLDAYVPVDRLLQGRSAAIQPCLLAGSNPNVIERVAEEWFRATHQAPWLLADRHRLPLTIAVEAPQRVGWDRLLNAVAARQLYPQQSVIVIDSGTATTVDAISAEGAFLGGAILPGLALGGRALHEYTSLLPQLSLHELAAECPAAVGKNTHQALHSGLFWGQVGAIRELVTRQCQELGWPVPEPTDPGSPRLLLSGGGSAGLAPHLPPADYIPSLALQGLVLLAWQTNLQHATTSAQGCFSRWQPAHGEESANHA